MAPVPKKPCNRCKKALTTGPYCPACQAIIDARGPRPENRESREERGYNKVWRKVRNIKIRKDPLCERCLIMGRVVRAVLVHHKDRNPHNNDPSNHESLCLKCHQAEHRFDGVEALRSAADYRRVHPRRY